MNIKKAFVSTVLATSFLTIATQSHAETIRAESGNPATFNSQLATMMSTFAGRDHNIDVQLSTGQNLAMSGVKVGAGRAEMTMIPTELYSYMTEGSKMYSGMGSQATQAAGELRSLFGYVHGAYHVFTWADSGINSWDDIAGKNVYMGPASSAASATMEQVVLANTGMMPNQGYNAVTMGWGASGQAFSDGQIDVMLSGAQIGSSSIEQFSLIKPIRFLGTSETGLESDAWQELLATLGQLTVDINNDTYDGVANPNGDITLLAFTMMSLVNQSMNEDTVYKLTSSIWDNIDEIHSSGPIFSDLTIDSAFTGVIAPLHPGAYRYYQEKGIHVPENLIP